MRVMSALETALAKVLQNTELEKALRAQTLALTELLARMEENGRPVPTDLAPLVAALRESQPASVAPQVNVNPQLVTPPGAAWRIEGRDTSDRAVAVDRGFSWVVTKL
jgi:hypothetical protein